jgi:tetratricopeptide (TPR) repeat protein
MERHLDRDGAQLEAALRNSTNFNDRSDYAIGLMYLGRSEEAVALLEQLEKEKPGEYFIAANLGTAYELSGNNSKALQWIKEGIRRNPKSHEGTEWLHVKILEAKISGQSDPTYFEKHSVLELDPAKISNEIEIAGQRLSPGKLAEAIEHQLGERMQFVKPPNPAVASLLFDYAAIEAVTHSLESAKKVFALANKYGYPRAKIDPLIKDYDQRIFSRKLKNHGIIALIGIGLVGLLVLAYKRGIFVLSRRDLKNPC